jgi:hypothetical protein
MGGLTSAASRRSVCDRRQGELKVGSARLTASRLDKRAMASSTYHAAAAASTSRLAGIDGGNGGLAFRFCSGEQLTRAGDVSARVPLANRP